MATSEEVARCPTPTLSEQALGDISEKESDGMPLHTSWTFWIDKTERGTSAAEYEACLRMLYTVKTVQGFWQVYNNIPKPSQLSPRYSYHLMRDKRRPVWEDEGNSRGGNWRMRCPKMESCNVWQELLLAVIGEQFADYVAAGDDIIGVSISVRDRGDDIIQIWNKESRLADKALIISRVPEILPKSFYVNIFYKVPANYKPRILTLKVKQTQKFINKLSECIPYSLSAESQKQNWT